MVIKMGYKVLDICSNEDASGEGVVPFYQLRVVGVQEFSTVIC